MLGSPLDRLGPACSCRHIDNTAVLLQEDFADSGTRRGGWWEPPRKGMWSTSEFLPSPLCSWLLRHPIKQSVMISFSKFHMYYRLFHWLQQDSLWRAPIPTVAGGKSFLEDNVVEQRGNFASAPHKGEQVQTVGMIIFPSPHCEYNKWVRLSAKWDAFRYEWFEGCEEQEGESFLKVVTCCAPVEAQNKRTLSSF